MLNELSDKYVKNPHFLFEFKEEGLYYKDYMTECTIPWDEFSEFEVAYNIVFLYNRNHETSNMSVYEEEIGKDKFDELIFFLRNKIPVVE